ncbi:hypothetical protein V8F20_012576 [Naviculisporaceae sp. PSN 640]
MDTAGRSRYFDDDSDSTDSDRSRRRTYYSEWYDKPWDRRKTKDQFSTWVPVQDRKFPQFSRLPIELRQLIWETFCPDLTARSRIFDLSLIPGSYIREGTREVGEIRNGASLRYQTQTARAVMAVHRESRCFAAKVLPDTLPLCRGRFDLRFNKHKDVVYIDHDYCLDVYLDAPCRPIPGVTDQIYQVAFCEVSFSLLKAPMSEFLGAFSNLRRTFVELDYSFTRIQDLKWCISTKVNHKYYEMFFVAYDGPGYQSQRYFWPDFTTPSGRDHAQNQIPFDTIALGKSRFDSWYDDYKDRNFLVAAREAGMDIWPLAKFGQHHGEEALERLEEYVVTGEIDGEPYGDSECNEFNGWQGWETVSETSGDGFDSRDDEESSTDDDEASAEDSNKSEDEEPWVHNSLGQKILESDLPPGSIIHWERCPALPSESGDDGDDEE